MTTGRPFEFIGVTNNTGVTQPVRLFIQRFTGGGGGNAATPRLKTMIFENGPQDVVPTEYTTSTGGDIVGPAVFGHDGAEDAIGTGAVPFNNSATVEPLLLARAGHALLRPGRWRRLRRRRSATPRTIQKPDVVATDGGANTFFGSNSAACSGSSGPPPPRRTTPASPHSSSPAIRRRLPLR